MADQRVISRIHRQVHKALKDVRLGPDKPLVVAVSGGPDSLTLLYALADLQEPLKLRLHGAHLDHGLRGSQGTADSRFVAQTFRTLGIPATVEEADVPSVRARDRLSVEEAARKVRYVFLSKVAHEVQAHAVALGHTADDQAETVLMHLIRGTGLTGLRGMEPLSRWRPSPDEPGLTLIRPLLNVTRQETEAYCRAQGLLPRQDESNLSSEFTRNRLRNQLLPVLQSFNPNIRDALLRLAHSAAQDLAYLESCVDNVWPQVVRQESWGLILNKQAFSALDPAIQHHLLRRAVRHIKDDLEDVELGHIQEMARLLARPAGKTLDLPGGILFSLSYEEAILTLGHPDLCPLPFMEGEHRLTVPGETLISGWRINTSMVPSEERRQNTDAYTAYLDSDEVGTELWLRTRGSGDRFQPLGMAQEKKLQDFMTDAKIPRSWRERIPLIVSPRGIVWVVGYRIAEWAQVRKETGKRFVIEFGKRDLSVGKARA